MNQGGAIVRYTASGPLVLEPWLECSLRKFSSSNLMVSPSHLITCQTSPRRLGMDWLGIYLLEIACDLGSLVLPWGVLLQSNLLEVGTSSNAITTIFDESYSLLGIIKLDPIHTSETRT